MLRRGKNYFLTKTPKHSTSQLPEEQEKSVVPQSTHARTMAGPRNPQGSTNGEAANTRISVPIAGADEKLKEIDGDVEKDRIRVVCFPVQGIWNILVLRKNNLEPEEMDIRSDIG